MAQLRALPTTVRQAAFDAFAPRRKCDLESMAAARSRGALLLRGVLDEPARLEALAHFQKLQNNHSAFTDSIRMWRFHGRR